MSSRVICRFREISGFLHASVDLCVRSQCAVNAPTVFPQYAQHAHMLATPVYYRFQKSIRSSTAGMVPVHWDPRGLQKAAVGSDRSEGEEVFRGLLASADHDPCRSALIVAAGAPRAPPEHSGRPARLGYVQSSYRKTVHAWTMMMAWKVRGSLEDYFRIR